MKFRNALSLYSLLVLISGSFGLSGQELGANFNHNAEIMDFGILEELDVDWVRTTPRILDYASGELSVEGDPALAKVVEASQRGYHIAFGFRWDFAAHKMRLPEPESEQEARLFELAGDILEVVGPYVDIFKLGNEPNLETLYEDQQPDAEGVVPLVRFTERLLTCVVEPYYQQHPAYHRPDIYAGSLPRLFMESEQKNPGVIEMMRFVQNDPRMTGLAIHLHISDLSEVTESFEFARKYIPNKPFIIPEFSLHRLYVSKLDEPIGNSPEGKAFLERYGHPREWKMYQWYTYANSNGVEPEELADLMATRDWYPQHYLESYFEAFEKYGVVLATYPPLQQSCPRVMTPDSPCWFLNPVLMQVTLTPTETGQPRRNPLAYEDYLALVKRHRKSGKKTDSAYFKNVILDEGPDPYVYRHSDGNYYVMVTKRDYLQLWRSKSFVDLEHAETKKIFFPPEQGSNGKLLWAPEIHFLDGAWYVYYSATDSAAPNGPEADAFRYVHVLRNTAKDPFQGEWEDLGKMNQSKAGIDGQVFEWKGQRYFTYSPYIGRQSGIALAKMKSPTELEQPEIVIGLPMYEWEMTLPREILEGPQFLEGPGDYVFMIYSAGACWDDNYGLGYFYAPKDADLMDPKVWKRSSEQAFNYTVRNSVYGPGHNCFTQSPDGSEDWIVYHGKKRSSNECSGRSTRAQRFGWDEKGFPILGEPVSTRMYLKTPSGTAK